MARSISPAVVLGLIAPLLLAPGASAALLLEERSIPSRTTTFRGLIITDVNDLPDRIEIVPDLPIGPPRMVIRSSNGTANMPAGCEPGLIFTRDVACPIGDYDIVGIETRGGADVVDIHVPHPRLTRRQIRSESTAIYFNVITGDGPDRLRSHAPGTDFAFGGSGKDVIKSGPSNDLVIGGRGADRLFGQGGLDQLFGAGGSDRLIGGAGVPDLHVGGRGRDRCVGAPRDLVASCERVRLGR